LLSGINKPTQSTFTNIVRNSGDDSSGLPDTYNQFLISITENIPPIDLNMISHLGRYLPDSIPEPFIVSEQSVHNALCKIKKKKSTSEPVLSNALIVEFADILAAPICFIVNSSFRQCCIPRQWKHSKVVPIPKIHPPASIESDLRPISVTSSLAKIAENFMCTHFNNHFKDVIDCNQFGSTAGRSTTLALLKFAEELYRSADNSKNIVRILFVDLSKAFDRVNHNILLKKFLSNDFPMHVTLWSLMFLSNRSQHVTIDSNSSSVLFSHAGTPQGTLAGPNNFKLLINDLELELPYIKYVDDLTCLSTSDDPCNDSLQCAANDITSWCDLNDMILSVPKTKEMIVHFGRHYNNSDIPSLLINGNKIERVPVFKLLGIVFSSDLSWQHHVDYIIKKASKRYFVIYNLNRARISPEDIVTVYCSLIRSILEYACPVWHSGLTTAQNNDIERVQKRCLRIVYPELSYRDALFVSGLEELATRRETITRNIFLDIKNPNNVIHNVLNKYKSNSCHLSTRSNYNFKSPQAKTDRYMNSFFPYCIKNKF